MKKDKEFERSLKFFDLLIFLLSFYILGSLVVETFFKISPEISRILQYIDNGICVVFLIDFIRNFKNAENKLQFMKWGWIDLIASIPNVDFLRAGRILRLVRIIRIIKAFKSTKYVVEHIFKNRIQGTLTSVALIAVLMMLFSTIAILQFETDPNSNIKTAEDAIWWAYVTITTVGYGDKYPVTTGGRIVAMMLMTVGVGLFGTFTAYISSWFVKDNTKNDQKK